MADPWHVRWLREGVIRWNRRRKRVPFKPDLSGLNFFELLPPDFRDDPKTSRYFEKIDLSEADLSNADLSRLNFRRANFEKARLLEADLSRSNFEKADFKQANLRGADFSGSFLTETEFEQAELASVTFFEAEADEAFFVATTLTENQLQQLAGSRYQTLASRDESLSLRRVPERTRGEVEQKSVPSDEGKTKKNVYEVFYGTTRNPIYERGAISDYGSDQWQDTNYGVARVIIPDGHRLGGIGKRLWRALFNRKSDDLRLDHLISLNEELFFRLIRGVEERSGASQRPTIFVHGYNTSFQEAVLRAAQFGHDLGLGQGIGLFSWPSKGLDLSYLADEASAELNKYAFADFLEKFIDAFPENGVSVVAHSMGCRIVLGSIELLASRNLDAANSLHQVILGAADVDSAIMPFVGKHTIFSADRTTSYVGNRDKALMLSRWLHKYDRVGLVPPPFVMEGLDTVLINDEDLGAWAHGYIAESRAVLNDIHSLLKRNAPPTDRFSIKSHQMAGMQIWKLAD